MISELFGDLKTTSGKKQQFLKIRQPKKQSATFNAFTCSPREHKEIRNHVIEATNFEKLAENR